MKKYIKSFTSFTTSERNNRTRNTKNSESRKELYDRVQDMIEGLDAHYSGEGITLNVHSRGSKGNVIDILRFGSSVPDRYRFTQEEAEDVAAVANEIATNMGISDRCTSEVVPEKSVRGYRVNVNIALDPNIED